MSLSNIARFVVVPVALATALAGAAFAKGGSPQTHHCKMPDGSMDMTKTHAQCTTAKGTWFKDVPTPGAGSGSATKPATPGAGSGSATAPAPKPPAPAPAK